MTAFTYTAQRSLTVGHSQGQQYSVDIPCRSIDPLKDVRKESTRSLGLASETLVWRNSGGWSISTKAFPATQRALLEEFLESVIEGETFTFDEFGSSNAADNPVSVELNGNYQISRAARQGDGGRDDYWRFSFAIRRV